MSRLHKPNRQTLKEILNLQRIFKELMKTGVAFFAFTHHWLILLNNNEFPGPISDRKYLERLSEYLPFNVSDACGYFTQIH
jgi:hypothetical protein